MISDENYIDDQDLDAAFQKAAQEHTPDFQESDWTAMSGMLDNIPTPIPQRGGLNLPKRWMLALLLLIGFVSTIGWFYINNTNDEVVEDKVGNVSDSEMLGGGKKTFGDTVIERDKKYEGDAYAVSIENKELEEEKGTRLTEHEEATTDLAGKTPIPQEAKAVRNTLHHSDNGIRFQPKNDIRQTTDKIDKLAVSGNNAQEFGGSKNSLLVNKGITNKTTNDATPDSKPVQSVGVIAASDEIPERTAFDSIEKLKSKTPHVRPEILFSQAIEPLTMEVAEPVGLATVPRAFQNGVSIRFAYSPDFSTVNSDFFKIGNNSAFLAEYRFKNRFVVQSGIIKSLKKYSASPTTYKWPDQWGNVPDNLSSITGTCDMLDIPLNLRFDLSQNQTSRFFINAGFTNYLMLNELYEYSYYNSPARWTAWEGKTGFYAASVLNFSTGFEKSISRNISLQVEPFVKLPVRELGFGKVRLTTLGVFASAKIKL